MIEYKRCAQGVVPLTAIRNEQLDRLPQTIPYYQLMVNAEQPTDVPCHSDQFERLICIQAQIWDLCLSILSNKTQLTLIQVCIRRHEYFRLIDR